MLILKRIANNSIKMKYLLKQLVVLLYRYTPPEVKFSRWNYVLAKIQLRLEENYG